MSTPEPEKKRDEPATPGELEAARALVLTHLNKYSAYHDHKERMAYTMTALYLTGASVWLFAESFWKSLPLNPQWILAIVVVIGALVTWSVVWQLVKRADAAVIVAACHDLLAEWITSPPKERTSIEAKDARGRKWPSALADKIGSTTWSERRKLLLPSGVMLLAIGLWTYFLVARTVQACATMGS